MEGFFFFHLFPEFPGQPPGDHADGDEGVDKLLIRRVPAGRPVLRNNHVRSSFPRGFLPLWFLKEKSRTFCRKILKVFSGMKKARRLPSTPEREKRADFPKNHRKISYAVFRQNGSKFSLLGIEKGKSLQHLTEGGRACGSQQIQQRGLLRPDAA
jgi:hypothetical protein